MPEEFMIRFNNLAQAKQAKEALLLRLVHYNIGNDSLQIRVGSYAADILGTLGYYSEVSAIKDV